MILKDMLNEVLAMSAHIKKSAFATSNDVDDQQMFAIANRVRQEIVSYRDWGALRKEHQISMLDNQYRYALPADWYELVTDSIHENASWKTVEVNVPEERWYEYKFGSTSDGNRFRARFYGNNIEFSEVQQDEVIRMEYVSRYSVKDDTGALKERFTSDTDEWLLDDDLFMLGVQANWAETKMLPQTGLWQNNYRDKMRSAIGREAGGEKIGGARRRHVIGMAPYTPLYKR